MDDGFQIKSVENINCMFTYVNVYKDKNVLYAPLEQTIWLPETFNLELYKNYRLYLTILRKIIISRYFWEFRKMCFSQKMSSLRLYLSR